MQKFELLIFSCFAFALGFFFLPQIANATIYVPTPAPNAYVNTQTISATLEIDESTCNSYGDGTWSMRINNGVNWYNGDARPCSVSTQVFVPSDFVREGGGAGIDYGDLVDELSVAGYSGGSPNSTIGSNNTDPTGIWDYTPASTSTTSTIAFDPEWSSSILLGFGLILFVVFFSFGYASLK